MVGFSSFFVLPHEVKSHGLWDVHSIYSPSDLVFFPAYLIAFG